MKALLDNLDRLLDNRVRLGIMALLSVHESVDFLTVKEALMLTDGNLAAHIAVLEREKYVRVTKAFVGKKPQTSYSATPTGRRAFMAHVDALERLIRQSK